MKTVDHIELLNRPNIYFLGIGGIGMSAMARYFKAKGKTVKGYDKTPSDLTKELTGEGIEIHYDDNPATIESGFPDKSKVLVIYTPAIPADHEELNHFRNNGYDVLKRAEVLGLISAGFFTVAIAGTHGKTTTSSILTHILRESGEKFIAFVGGINQNSNSNVVVRDNANIMVTEADEYDKSFLKLHPDIALVTSLDADHLDIYGNDGEVKKTYRQFAGQLKAGGILITTTENKSQFDAHHPITYGLVSGDFHCINLRIDKGVYRFDIKAPASRINNCTFTLPGRHNLENALGATAIALQLSVSGSVIKSALGSYKGVKRRFEVHVNTGKLLYIDDYAHHPSEIKACLASVKEMYPEKKITGIFQPHLYSRTRDFAEGFSESLESLDELILLDIYPAREKPIAGVSSNMIADGMKLKNVTVCSKEELLGMLKEKQPEAVVTMGAGDIDRLVNPIKKLISGQYA